MPYRDHSLPRSHFELLLVVRAGCYALWKLAYIPRMGPDWRQDPPVWNRGAFWPLRRKHHESERWKHVNEGFDWSVVSHPIRVLILHAFLLFLPLCSLLVSPLCCC